MYFGSFSYKGHVSSFTYEIYRHMMIIENGRRLIVIFLFFISSKVANWEKVGAPVSLSLVFLFYLNVSDEIYKHLKSFNFVLHL